MADDYVLNILTSWNVDEEALNAFKEENITKNSFSLLDDETIKSLFNKSGAGPRLEFKQKYNKYISEKNSELSSNISTCTTLSNQSLSSVDSTVFLSDVITLDSIDLPVPYLLHNTSTSKDKENQGPEETEYQKSNPSKKIKYNDVFSDSLENILKTTTNGKVALKNKLSLTNDDRHKICSIVVNELLANTTNGRVPAENFEKAAVEIEKLFPYEQRNIYFMPYVPKTENTPRILARGKLWSRYINAKRSLKNHKKINTDEGIIENKDEESNIGNEEYINYLMTCTGPDDTIDDYWEKTCNAREKYLTQLDTTAYIKKFPVLNTLTGYRLLLQDFNRLFPGKENVFYEKWPLLAEKILKITNKKYKLEIDEEEDPEVFALKALAYAFKPTTVNYSKKKTWRPSRVEMQESVFIQLQNVADIPQKIEERRSKLLKVGGTLQPFVVTIGALKKNASSYIIINNIQYEIESPLRAVDICFKIFHVLKLHYPQEAQYIWLFIQREVFNITTPWDRGEPAVATLLSEMSAI